MATIDCNECSNLDKKKLDLKDCKGYHIFVCKILKWVVDPVAMKDCLAYKPK